MDFGLADAFVRLVRGAVKDASSYLKTARTFTSDRPMFGSADDHSNRELRWKQEG